MIFDKTESKFSGEIQKNICMYYTRANAYYTLEYAVSKEMSMGKKMFIGKAQQCVQSRRGGILIFNSQGFSGRFLNS